MKGAFCYSRLMNRLLLAVLILACAASAHAAGAAAATPPTEDLSADFDKRYARLAEEIEAEHKAEAALAERFFKQDQSLREELKQARLTYERKQADRFKALWEKHKAEPRHVFDAELRKLDREIVRERREFDKELDAKRRAAFDRQRDERDAAFKSRMEKRKGS